MSQLASKGQNSTIDDLAFEGRCNDLLDEAED